MNLGIYLTSIADQNQMKDIAECVNKGLQTRLLSDASVFFDNVAHNEHKLNCGMFNSSELWNFSGKLVTTSLSTTISALKIVNNIDLYYYYGWEKNISPLSLIYLSKQKLKIACTSQESEKDFYRKTGIYPLIVSETFEKLAQSMT
jgi:hypothetical protein